MFDDVVINHRLGIHTSLNPNRMDLNTHAYSVSQHLRSRQEEYYNEGAQTEDHWSQSKGLREDGAPQHGASRPSCELPRRNARSRPAALRLGKQRVQDQAWTDPAPDLATGQGSLVPRGSSRGRQAGSRREPQEATSTAGRDRNPGHVATASPDRPPGQYR